MINSTTNKISYACNGSTTDFLFAFAVNSSSEIIVVLRADTAGTDTTLIEDSDYTVTFTGSSAPYVGGKITTTSAYASGNTLFICRSIVLTQITDLVENDDLPADTLEDRLDTLTMQIQDLQEQINRCLKLPITDGTIVTELDDKVARASTYLAFSSAGVPTATASVAPATATVTTWAETLLDDTTASAARTTLGVWDETQIVCYNGSPVVYEGEVILNTL